MIFFDQPLAGTPFRGLILKGFAGYCAYIGVPQEHWLSDMEGLEFDCHFGITFRGPGGDGLRPDGWYWYGWDYQHAGDALEYPAELLSEMPPEMTRLLGSMNRNSKKWTIPEIEQDLIDAAVELSGALESAVSTADCLVAGVMHGMLIDPRSQK